MPSLTRALSGARAAGGGGGADLFGLVCKRWLRLQSSESRRLRARADPVMLRRMADRFTGLLELDLSQSAWSSFYPGVTDSDFAVIAAGFRKFRVIDLQNCKGEFFSAQSM